MMPPGGGVKLGIVLNSAMPPLSGTTPPDQFDGLLQLPPVAPTSTAQVPLVCAVADVIVLAAPSDARRTAVVRRRRVARDECMILLLRLCGAAESPAAAMRLVFPGDEGYFNARRGSSKARRMYGAG